MGLKGYGLWVNLIQRAAPHLGVARRQRALGQRARVFGVHGDRGRQVHVREVALGVPLQVVADGHPRRKQYR
jgi:hypothetical protein